MAKNTISIAQIAFACGVTNVCVLNWLKGSNRRDPLPLASDERPKAVNISVFKKWAAKAGVEITSDPAELVANWETRKADAAALAEKAVKKAKKSAATAAKKTMASKIAKATKPKKVKPAPEAAATA